MSDLADYALMYAARGWYVFPLWPGQSTPLLPKPGYHSASNDLTQVAEWWTRWPDANIGINLARSGLTAFDVDPQNGGDVTHREQFPDVRSPLASFTPSGGEHHLFIVPEGTEVKAQPGKGIDGKWNGYIVLPPSRRRGVDKKCDGDYVWQGDMMADAPVMPDVMIKPPALPIERPTASTVSSLADVALITEALTYLKDYDDYRGDNWLHVAMGLHHWENTTPDADGVGWAILVEWSLRDPHGSYDEHSCRKRWDSLKVDKAATVTLGSMFHRAQHVGWPGARKLSADLAAAAFGGGPREPAPWTTEPVPEYRSQTPTADVLPELLSRIDWFGKAWSDGKVNSIIRTLAWATGSNCEAVLSILSGHHSIKDSPPLRTSIAEICRAQTEWKSVTPERRKWEDNPTIEPVSALAFADLRVAELEKTTNDHMKDAQQLQAITFENRLAHFNWTPHWWTGARWEMASENYLSRHVGRALNNMDSKITNSRVSGTVSLLRQQMPNGGMLNPPSTKLFFQNCVLDVESRSVGLHAANLCNGYLLSVDYVPGAECPQWAAWLRDIFERDLGRIALLQEVFGWCMVTDTLGIQKAVTLMGVTRGGKGTILGLLARLLGDAAGAFQLADLIDDKVLAGMRSRNVVIDYDASEPERNTAKQVTGRFKAITANEPLSIKMLYTQEPFQGALNCKMIIAANQVPTLWDDSGASAKRWVPLVFDKSFEGREDTELLDRLASELPGIAVWAIEGLERLMTQGRFTVPESSREALEELVNSASPVRPFIRECCVFDRTARTRDRDVWAAYEEWCRVNHIDPGKKTHFNHSFVAGILGTGAVRKPIAFPDGGSQMGYDGLSLRDSRFQGGNVHPFSPPPKL